MSETKPSSTTSPGAASQKNEVNAPGVVESIRTWIQGIHEYLLIRAELAGIESKAAARRLTRILIFVAVALPAVVLGSLYLSLSLIYVLAEKAGWGWGWALFATAITLLLVAAIAVLMSWASVKGKWFPVTISELKKDSAWLSRKTNKNA